MRVSSTCDGNLLDAVGDAVTSVLGLKPLSVSQYRDYYYLQSMLIPAVSYVGWKS